MKRYPILRRLLCFNLSVVMLFSSQVAVFASESGGGSIRQETIISSEEGNTEDSSTKESSKEESSKEESNTNKSNTNSEDISTNLSNTQINSEEVSSKKENSKKEDNQKDSNTEDKTFNIKKGDFYISAFVPAGTFDEDVEFKADQVKLTKSEKELVSKTMDSDEMENYYAFDLRFEADSEEIEPREGSSVKISIESSLIVTDAVVHIKDDKTAETIESDITQDKVSFETDSFSTYVFPAAEPKYTIYGNTAYGSAKVSQCIDKVRATVSDAYQKDRFALRIFHQNNGNKEAVEIAPADSLKCLIFGGGLSTYYTFRFTAPENYYVAKVQVGETKRVPILRTNKRGEQYWSETDGFYNIRTFTPSERYASEFILTTELKRMGEEDNKITNALILDLRPLPTVLKDKYTYVNGATFVNYVNGNLTGDSGTPQKKFGQNFLFSSGQIGDDSNHCHYTKVYQGLAKDDISDGYFNLASEYGNKVSFFPEYKEYNAYKDKNGKYKGYIEGYYHDTRVKFNLDEDGYWTLDSSKYKYIYNGKTNTVETTWGEEFRPFITDGVDDSHFGMMLPINFCVAEDGLSNGEDTIFKFFGDDDVFVYVDGKLVLDLGGIHDAVKGQINFTTGEVFIQGDYNNELTSSVDGSCYQKKGIGVTSLYTTDKNGKAVKGILSDKNVGEFSKRQHVLTVVYFERGAHRSNCKISYNFNKTETRNVDFQGLKVDENKNGLAGAEFTLYTDEACTEVATIGVGTPAVSVSDNNGTIAFSNLSAGVIKENESSVSKTYYLKETKAPEGYVTPEDARWKLSFTVPKEGEATKVLTPLTAEAQALSLNQWFGPVNDNYTNVRAVQNIPIRYEKKLFVSKKVAYGSDKYKDLDGEYIFKIYEVDEKNVYKALANQKYLIGQKEFKTDEKGQFILKADETAVFEKLLGKKYQIAEVGVNSKNGYTLRNYSTKIIVDNNPSTLIQYEENDAVDRSIEVAYESNEDKVVEFENNLVKVFDWQLVKISKTSKMPLAGAEFTLASKEKGSTDKYYGKSDSHGVVLWYESVSDREYNINPIEIPVGSYTLSETIAPGGYAKSEDVWQITIDRDSGVQAYINYPGDLAASSVFHEETLENGATLKTVKFSFENEVVYTLPATGGSGIHLYTIGGVLLLLVASLLLYKDKKIYLRRILR